MNNKGVTLIELLIVIVVIGIIATFAVPAVGDIITNSEKDAVLQDARALADQARLYCGQGLCTGANDLDANGGITWTELQAMGGLDVFDATKYDTTSEILQKTAGGIWTVQLIPSATGDYGFGGTFALPAYADPVPADRTAVYDAE